MDKDKWEKHPVSGDYEGTTREIERLMRLKESFDLIGREVRVAAAGQRCISWMASSRMRFWKS